MTSSNAPFCGNSYIVEITVSVLAKKTVGEILLWFDIDSKYPTVQISEYA
jgi:hypothetical protein